ncbi:restriction endonuclease subunit S [Tepidiphilus baoligensis]|uniref:Restriction endonuclease subunit S n=1 Tax=Tepidiphilus baoligensis TaxID=2698687 RepID=A0ABX1QQ35_9PROT|nr:restriction endonuclease subunit S [Tepidiphilus baoligensis]
MPGEWQTARIEEVAERVAMGPFGSSIKVETFVSEGVPVISGQHLHGSRVDDKPGFNFITQEHAEKLRNANVQRGDVIFTHRGTIGQVSYIPSTSAYVCYVISQSQFFLRPDKNKVLPEFLVAYFRSPEGQHKLLANTSQVGVPSIAQPVTYLRSLEIPLPPLPEQRAIAHILGTLDDKIENLRKQNETLEAMARALFKAWFVDFEPVRAKIEGRWQRGESLPGLPAHLYDLFPDRLVESELGEIPEGWEMRPLDAIANYLNGLALQKFPPESEDEFLPVIKIAQLRAGNTIGADKATTRIKPEYIVNDGDVLFSWSGSLEVEVWNGGRGALNQHLFKVTSDVVPKWFYFFAIRHHLQNFRAIAADKATTMGHIQRKHLTSAKIAVSSPESMKKFDIVISPLFNQLVENAQQSRTLAQLRDTLLPKLISGELRVKDAEAFLERAGV